MDDSVKVSGLGMFLTERLRHDPEWDFQSKRRLWNMTMSELNYAMGTAERLHAESLCLIEAFESLNRRFAEVEDRMRVIQKHAMYSAQNSDQLAFDCKSPRFAPQSRFPL